MKNVILISIALLTLFFFNSYSQKGFDKYLKDNPLSNKSDSLQFQIAYTNYCLSKYRIEKSIGTSLQAISAGMVCYYVLPKMNGTERVEKEYFRETVINEASNDVKLSALRKYERSLRIIENRKENAILAGSIMFISGSLIHLYSNRWFNKSKIKPAENGIGIQLNF